MKNSGFRKRVRIPRLSFSAQLLVFALVLLICEWIALSARIHRERSEIVIRAEATADSLVRIFAERTSRVVDRIDQSSLLIKYEFEHGPNALSDATLSYAAAPLAQYGTILVNILNARGDVVMSNRPFKPTNLADRQHFLALQAADTGALFIGVVHIGRMSKVPTIQFSRRLNRPDGEFAGTIVFSVEPSFFVNSYDPAQMGDHGVLALLGSDGTIRVRRDGYNVSYGGRFPIASFYPNQIGTAVTTVDGINPIDGERRITSYQALKGLPLVAVVALSKNEVLIPFERRLHLYVGGGLLASAMIVAFVALLLLKEAKLQKIREDAQRAQAMYRAAAEGSLDAFYILSAVRDASGKIEDFRFVDLNRRGCELIGHSLDQLVGQTLRENLPPRWSSAIFERYRGVMETGITVQEEIELRGEPGQSVWLHHQIVRVEDGVAVTARDVTLRRVAEAQTRTDRAFLQTLVDNLPLGVYMKTMLPDAYGKMLVWNEAAEYITGYKASHVMGLTVSEIFPPEQARKFNTFDQTIVETCTIRNVPEQIFKRRDGETRYLRIVAVPILNDAGSTEYILGIAEDITQRRIQERTLAAKQLLAQRAAQALERSEARLRTIADVLPLLIAYVDANERYRFVNHAYEVLFGVPRKEIEGKTIKEFRGEARHRQYHPYIERALKGESVIFEDESGTGGRYACREIRFIPQMDPTTSRVLGFHVMVQDVTAVKVGERRLKRLAEIDGLTGLFNRAALEERLDQSLQDGYHNARQVAVLYLDIDYFKRVNDSKGHLVGDALLKAFAHRLRQVVRDTDVVARLGGDEFVVVLDPVSRASYATAVAEKILESTRVPFTIDSEEIQVTTSVGVAVITAGLDNSRDGILKRADEMLYRAKASGRDTFAFFHDG